MCWRAYVPVSKLSLRIVVVVPVLLFPRSHCSDLVRCPSKAKDFRKVVCGLGGEHTYLRVQRSSFLWDQVCFVWAVLGSGNGTYKLYIEIIGLLHSARRSVMAGWWTSLLGCRELCQGHPENSRRGSEVGARRSTSGLAVRREPCFFSMVKLTI